MPISEPITVNIIPTTGTDASRFAKKPTIAQTIRKITS